jgi:hypothetical protein
MDDVDLLKAFEVAKNEGGSSQEPAWSQDRISKTRKFGWGYITAVSISTLAIRRNECLLRLHSAFLDTVALVGTRVF